MVELKKTFDKKKISGKCVLLYSGGLDTSVLCKWIPENYGLEVIALTVDVGQNEDLAQVREKARAMGVKHVVVDAKREFVEKFVFPAIRANALYGGTYPVSTSLARPLLAEKAVEVAKKEGCVAIAHGCTGKGNDQVRFDVTIKSLAPELEVVAPVREWNMDRETELKYAQEHRLPVNVSKQKNYSVDQNLWGRSVEGHWLEDPFAEAREDAFEWTKNIDAAPDAPTYLEIEFESGAPKKNKMGIQGRKHRPRRGNRFDKNRSRTQRDCRQKRRWEDRPHGRPRNRAQDARGLRMPVRSNADCRSQGLGKTRAFKARA